MSNGSDIVDFVKDPRQLVKLCRDVIDQLDTSSEYAAVAEQEAQLRAISTAIKYLDKNRVIVPDPLRAEKTRLTVALTEHTNAKLAQLADEFQDILKDLRTRLGQNTTAKKGKLHDTRSKLPKTPQVVLREHILQALRKLGGRAQVSDVIEEMARQLEGKLFPSDILWRKATNDLAWQNSAKWERFKMTQDGVLKQNSPRGIWELGEVSE